MYLNMGCLVILFYIRFADALMFSSSKTLMFLSVRIVLERFDLQVPQDADLLVIQDIRDTEFTVYTRYSGVCAKNMPHNSDFSDGVSEWNDLVGDEVQISSPQRLNPLSRASRVWVHYRYRTWKRLRLCSKLEQERELPTLP